MKELVKKVKLLEPLDIERIAISRDHYFPNAYMIDLPLDSTPDHVWQDIFEWEWKSSRHLWDRKLFVVGDKLRLVTTVNSIEEKIDWVREVIDRTNMSIDEYHKDMEARASQIEEQLKKQVVEEEAKIEKIRDTLRRRFAAI
jgi:hypothetical protein